MHHDHDTPASAPAPRIGRAPATTSRELSHIALALFLEQGFDATTIDDIARAAGIGRRTFFRYFASKNELPWGDFDELLTEFRHRLATTDRNVPMMRAIRQAVVAFNAFPPAETAAHRGRMWLLLNVPSLTAYSTIKYTAWREVIAEFVAERRGEAPNDLAPQAIAWVCLGLSLSAYEHWVADPASHLPELLEAAYASADSVFGLGEVPDPDAGVSPAASR